MTDAVMGRKRPLSLGLYLPNGDGYMGGGLETWPAILEMAQAAEAVGFDSVWVADHMLFRFDDGEEMGRWEAWTLMAGLAAATKTLQIGPLVSCMSFRNPAMLAKMAETVDEISQGRFILGMGAGWHEPEYAAFGFPFDHRVSRFEEGIEIIHGLLRTGRSDFSGNWYETRNAVIRPRGPRPGGIPLMIGSNGERMLKMTAKYADAWNTTWLSEPADVVPLLGPVDAACEAIGRDPKSLKRSACILVDLPGHVQRFPWAKPVPPPVREPGEIAEILHGFAAVGVEEVMIWLDPNSPAGVEAFARTIEILDRG